MVTPQSEAIRLLEESLKELEANKGSVLSAVQKLLRSSVLLERSDIQLWCSIQLGDSLYTKPLSKFLDMLRVKADNKKTREEIDAQRAELGKLGLKHEFHYTNEELRIKARDEGGGYVNVGFIEERYADLVRTKRGNDDTYYKIPLAEHLSYIRRKAHEYADALLNQVRFLGTTSNCFDILRSAVDDRLLDLNPTLAEQLMLAFKSVSSTKDEEWTHALTTCRRLLEGLADELQPASSEPIKGRVLTQGQYVNRLWAFMDKAIESGSNKELAKAHVDFLGAWIEKVNKITNKGVHAAVGQLEAVKAVFHTYLAVADLLDYLHSSPDVKGRPNINISTIDEIEALLDVSRSTAKEIIKTRVLNGKIDEVILKQVKGVGPKTLAKAVEVFSFK